MKADPKWGSGKTLRTHHWRSQWKEHCEETGAETANGNLGDELDLAERLAEEGIVQDSLTHLGAFEAWIAYTWASRDPVWVISAEVDPADWPAWTDEVVIGIPEQRKGGAE